ncbi:MAG TPA: sigma-54 dependent transcriptional regulator, partial [Candidatus Kryptonia bacterium]|nr:sigma-54 dependent transcriptional regulator [Candidatus Kryptonia bacterium]
PDVPVVVITAFGSLDSAVAAIRAGAYDFITKPVKIDALALALDRAVRHRALRVEVKRLRQMVVDTQRFEEVLGESPPMRKVHELLGRIADSDSSVLVTGESGTGKEVVAKALHRRSRRGHGPFVAINCAAMPETLLESELFGHARGAFTDARTPRTGLFVQASGGTLLLDEIGDLPLSLQPKLLRALEERVVRPVGGNEEIAFDVRLIATTNRDLDSAVEDGRFREDLYFRINVIHLVLPPLRARGTDVLLLAQHFLSHDALKAGKSVSAISPEAAERLLAYSWPGNVRELRNCIERAVALTQYEQITVDDLPEKIQAYRRSHVLVTSDDPSELVPLEEVERRYILQVMDAVGGNKTLAAQVLGLGRKTLYRKLEQYAYGDGRGGSEANRKT